MISMICKVKFHIFVNENSLNGSLTSVTIQRESVGFLIICIFIYTVVYLFLIRVFVMNVGNVVLNHKFNSYRSLTLIGM